MKCFRTCCITLLLLAIALAAYGQIGRAEVTTAMPKPSMTGKIVDGSNGAPLEYAMVIVANQNDSRLSTGCVASGDGSFMLNGLFPGPYRITVQFMGYKTQVLEDVKPAGGRAKVDIGVIRLRPAVLAGESVKVEADRPEFEYKIDRRVINVGQQQTALSGTAVDVLENVPSVTVDVEGNVQLRGSSNFTVLIDNRPTPLDPNLTLQQTPASIIERIEIITNPSAKYDPDGTAGIINLTLKKSDRGGVSGIFNANLGLDDLRNRSGGDFLLNRRKGKTTLFIGGDYNRRSFPGTSATEQRNFIGDTTLFRSSSGDSRRGGKGYSLRGGVDHAFTDRDLLNAAFRVGGHDFGGRSDNRYDEWSEPGGVHALRLSHDESNRGERFYEANLDFKHDFAKKGHELQAQFILEGESGNDEDVNRLFGAGDSLIVGQRSTESGPTRDLRVKLDYTLPLRPDEKFQAGYQNRTASGEEKTERFDYEAAASGFVLQQPFSHAIGSTHTIHSLYATYSNEMRKLGYQAGLRGEYTGRDIRLKDTGEQFTIDRWDVFPTTHLSYTFAEGKQVMGSYTRRVERPRDWDLEPFETWMDAYNVRKGNPGLRPEFIDSYEATFQSSAGQSLISIEAYYRMTTNKIERVQSLYAPRVTLQTVANIGRDKSFGSEIMVNASPLKAWNLNLMGNLYQYRVEGELLDESFSRKSFNWSVRLNNTLRITPSTRLQANWMYNSPTVSSQGRREGNSMVNFSLRQELLGKALAATLQVRDAFKTGVFESTVEGPDFSNHSRFQRRAPVFTLTLTYNINNYRNERLHENGEGNGMEIEGEPN
jgi:outer membrane receptor protein involved in Fe transport